MVPEQVQKLSVKIVPPPVEAPLALLQMKVESSSEHTVEFSKTGTRKAPEIIDNIFALSRLGDFERPRMFRVYQSAKALTSCVAQERFVHAPCADNSAKRNSFTFRYNLYVNLILVAQESQEGLASRSATSVSTASTDDASVLI